MLNNQIGRDIGKANPTASPREFAIKTLDNFHNNGLYTATVNKDGTVTIGKTKISDAQYKHALNVLNSTNNNNFTPDQQQQHDEEIDKRNAENYKEYTI